MIGMTTISTFSVAVSSPNSSIGDPGEWIKILQSPFEEIKQPPHTWILAKRNPLVGKIHPGHPLVVIPNPDLSRHDGPPQGGHVFHAQLSPSFQRLFTETDHRTLRVHLIFPAKTVEKRKPIIHGLGPSMFGAAKKLDISNNYNYILIIFSNNYSVFWAWWPFE
jgi:hypothetical protein